MNFDLDQYNLDRKRIESELAAIRLAVEQRTQDAIQCITEQRDSLIANIDEHIENEQAINWYLDFSKKKISLWFVLVSNIMN